MLRGERTNRIRGRRIAGEQKSLAAATAEVARAAVAAPARFRHPAFIPEAVERRRVLPDPPQGVLAGVRELEARNHTGGMARQHAAGRIDQHLLMSPAVHARLGIFRVIVGQNKIDPQVAFEPLARGFHDLDGAVHLLPRRQQRLAIAQRPAVILHVRDLHAAARRCPRRTQSFPPGDPRLRRCTTMFNVNAIAALADHLRACAA